METEAVHLMIDLPVPRKRLVSREDVVEAVREFLSRKIRVELEAYTTGDGVVVLCPEGTLERWEERASYGVGF